jgi:hypothetical protein
MVKISTQAETGDILTFVLWHGRPYVQMLDIGKAIPLQAWTGPEGSRSLSIPDFKTIGT